MGITNNVQGATVTLYTPYRHAVYAFTNSEFSSSGISSINQQYTQQYPNATLIANASNTHNCHSYAWNMTEGGIICWLNQTPDLHWYWDDGSYEQTTEVSAQKIYYYSGDHSAIKSPTHTGMYESKWGQAPRMRHAPNYGPAIYNMNYRRYYKKTPLTISGPTLVLNAGSTYTVRGVSGGSSVTPACRN